MINKEWFEILLFVILKTPIPIPNIFQSFKDAMFIRIMYIGKVDYRIGYKNKTMWITYRFSMLSLLVLWYNIMITLYNAVECWIDTNIIQYSTNQLYLLQKKNIIFMKIHKLFRVVIIKILQYKFK